MFEFSQLGFLLFLHPYNGVWLMFFWLVSSYWVGGATWEAIKEKKSKEQSV
jgi:hypothetical protein